MIKNLMIVTEDPKFDGSGLWLFALIFVGLIIALSLGGRKK